DLRKRLVVTVEEDAHEEPVGQRRQDEPDTHCEIKLHCAPPSTAPRLSSRKSALVISGAGAWRVMRHKMKIAIVAPSCPLKPEAAERMEAIVAARGDCELAI